MSDKVGITELSELLDFATKVVSDLAKAKGDDGKIDFIEIVNVALDSASDGVKAVMGIDQAAAEIKDLDVEEAKVLVQKCVLLVSAVVALLKSPK